MIKPKCDSPVNNLCCKKKKKMSSFSLLNNLFLYSLHTLGSTTRKNDSPRSTDTSKARLSRRRPSGCCCCHPLWHSSRSRFICLGLVLARSSSYSHWKRAKTTFHHTQEQKNCPINLIVFFFSEHLHFTDKKLVSIDHTFFFDLSVFIAIQGQSVVKDLVSYLFLKKRFAERLQLFYDCWVALEKLPTPSSLSSSAFYKMFFLFFTKMERFPISARCSRRSRQLSHTKTPFSIWASWGNRSFYLLYNDLIEKRGRAHYLPRLGLLYQRRRLVRHPLFSPVLTAVIRRVYQFTAWQVVSVPVPKSAFGGVSVFLRLSSFACVCGMMMI